MARGSLTGDISGARVLVGLQSVGAWNWRKSRLALRRWSCKDLGDLQLVLERAVEGSRGAVWEEDVQVQTPPPTGAEGEVRAGRAGGVGGVGVGLGGGEVKLDLDFEPLLYTALAFAALLVIGYACS